MDSENLVWSLIGVLNDNYWNGYSGMNKMEGDDHRTGNLKLKFQR